MKKILFIMMAMLAMGSMDVFSQSNVIVVIANKNVVYEDPRWGGEQSISKGQAISVSNTTGTHYQWWPYPAADVSLAKKQFHIPGTWKGEKCIVINGTNVRFREKASLQSGILCYNTASGASYYQTGFIEDSSVKKEIIEEGSIVYWDPYYLPKGTRLPYKGKEGDFYKTELNGMTLYISTKYSYVK